MIATKLSSKTFEVDIWNESIQLSKDLIAREMELLNSRRQELKSTDCGQIQKVSELWEGQPHRFFFFSFLNVTYVGQKLISPIVTKFGSPGLFCSLIRPEMILGPLQRTATSQEGVEIVFRKLSGTQKFEIFSALVQNPMIDVYYPFMQMDRQGKREINTPPEGWFLTEERAQILGQGETHLRAYSVEFLKEEGLQDAVVYDPACSTGQFLAELRTHLPALKVYGQDLSEQMCTYARQKLPNVFHGNSLSPKMPNSSCDYIFFRFLNAEVVNTSLAIQLFDRLIQCLKPGGKAILFGHTPVLVPPSHWENLGFKTLRHTASLPDRSAVFQYYIIQEK